MNAHRAAGAGTIDGAVRCHAAERPSERAYVFLRDGEDEIAVLTWRDLDDRSRSIAAILQQRTRPGDRALLVYPPGLDFIAAFFGCLYAGVIAVPAQPPGPGRGSRAAARLAAIAADCDPAVVLTTTALDGRGRSDLPAWHCARWLPETLCTDDVDLSTAPEWQDGTADDRGIAFLQYTSGSTASPRGVMVTHANLRHNLEAARRLATDCVVPASVSWLPVTHDMGLIEGVLQPALRGHVAILMAPNAFLQRPVRWLQAISRYRAARSGGPNFAYDLCVQRVDDTALAALDLSCWHDAYNGAEPVRGETMAAFATRFRAAGFRASAFRPSYGLAEATLVVSSARWGGAAESPVCCGRAIDDTDVVAVDPETSTRCEAGAPGELWIRGPGVAAGYWNLPADTVRTFAARTADGDGPFLRTGDLGRVTAAGVTVTGRLKDVLIVRGAKLFPQDLEQTTAAAHPAIRPAGVSAVSCSADVGGDRIVIAAEVDPRCAATPAVAREIIAAIRIAIHEQHGVQLHAIALVAPGGVPRTTSGKVQRYLCRRGWTTGELPTLAEWRMPLTA